MFYTKIRINYKFGPKGRFDRVLLVKDEPNLLKLGVAFCTILNARFGHCFLFENDETSDKYVMASFMEDPASGLDHYIKYYDLEDLSSTFTFTYDTGEGYVFKCRKYARMVEMDSEKEFILLDGHGAGIFEDNITSLDAYLHGDIDPKSSESDLNSGIVLPWNLKLNTFGDFDAPLDLEKINRTLTTKINDHYKTINQSEKEYIEKHDLDIDDVDDMDEDIKIAESKEERVKLIQEIMDDMVDDQIKKVDFVKDAYNSLKEMFGENDAKAAISSILEVHIEMSLMTKQKFDNDLYRKDLQDLVKDCTKKYQEFITKKNDPSK
jgi:hypothetical protein